MHIEIIFDAVCPWCYIGKRRLEKALALRPHIRATAQWRPFLLNPEMPPEGIDRTAYLIRKFGGEARVRHVYGAIGEAGESVTVLLLDQDARLHDLRHAHASHAVMNGESLHVAGRLLGHRRASTTNRYVHLDDATLSQAAERVTETIERKLAYNQPHISAIL